MANRKPSAAERTADMFSGATVAQEKEAATEAAKAADVAETTVRELAKPIEEVMDDRRDQAFEVQEALTESLSKHFKDRPGELPETFRLSTKGAWMFLETLRHTAAGPAYFWSGVMFRADSLYEITSVFVRASKERHESSQ